MQNPAADGRGGDDGLSGLFAAAHDNRQGNGLEGAAQRLDLAVDLIRNSFLSIKQVMAEVGWSDPSHFCRDFKRRFGVTPRALRRQGRV